MASSEAGISIRESETQEANADSPIFDSFEPDSNVTLIRDEQFKKHSCRIAPTADGMQIDKSEEHDSNAELPIDERRERDSKMTTARRLQS
jgi:hypothetical protein